NPTHAQETVTIGVAVPLSGPLAPLGAEIEAGVRAAAAQLNDAGGVRGMNVAVEAIDDGCAEERALAVANRLAGAGVVMVVGHLCSAPAIAAAPVYVGERIIQIAPGAPDPAYTEEARGTGTFRLHARSDAEAGVVTEFLAATFPTATIAIIDDRTSYGRSLATGVRDGLAARGLTAIVSQSYFRSELDPAALADRLRAAGVGVVFAAGDPAEMAALRNDLVAAGIDAPFVTGDVAADPAFLAGAGDNADGVIFTFPPDYAAAPAAAVPVAALAAAGAIAGNAALTGFAAVEVWADAVQAAENLDYEDVAAAIEAGVFTTALGTIAFNDIGEADVAGWIVQVWEDGIHTPYQP
ncbi:MAG: branched-chain amino acid ABC transporter substrate-binding protein, partial [Bauldia sp.]